MSIQPIDSISSLSIQMATLKDGTKVPVTTLNSTIEALRFRIKNHFAAFFMLATKCKDPGYEAIYKLFW